VKKAVLSTLQEPKSVLTIVFTVTFAFLSFMIYKLHSLELENERTQVETIAANYAYDIKSVLDQTLSSTYVLQALLTQSKQKRIENFEAIAGRMISSYPGIMELAIAPRGIIQQVAPLQGNEKALGLNIFETSAFKQEAFLTKESGVLTLAGPIELVQGSVGVVGRLPIFEIEDGQERFWGFALAVIRVSELFEYIKVSTLNGESLAFEVWRKHPDTQLPQTIYQSHADKIKHPVEYAFEVPNNRWMIRMAPLHGWGNASVFIFRELIALAFAFVLAYMAKFLVDLKRAKKALESKVIQTGNEKETLQERLDVLINTIPDLIWLKDPSGAYLFCNRAFERLYGIREAEIVGHTDYDFVDKKTADFFRTNDLLAADAKTSVRNEEKLVFHSDGYQGLFEAIKTPMYDHKGQLIGILGIARDITARRENEVKIERLEYFDPLTSLPNKVQLRIRLEHDLSMMEKKHEQLAVLFIDFDHFKNINDTLGHAFGDELLVQVSKRLQGVLRPIDTLSRQGGDEFVIVLPSVRVDDVVHTAKRVLQTIEQPICLQEHELVITASIGIALYPSDGADVDTLFKSADAAMYLAKKDGRNNYRFFTAEIQNRSARFLNLENALRYAHTRGELMLHYQPQVCLKEGKIIGVEALLRWNHPDLGSISPSEFIPIAEESGQILLIGEWVMRTAALRLKQWIDTGYPPMSVAVNLSAVQFHHAHLSRLVQTIIDEVQLPPDALELELTESVAAQNPEHAIETMNALAKQGIRLSIDDFGTGYSSLSYLKRFKVYKLKIDQSFIRDIQIDPEDKEIVKTIIALGKSLGLKVIAEGVETVEQLDFLKEYGCDEAQGYYFSKPLSIADLEALLYHPEIISQKNSSSLPPF
jgi:diguanylate cyclase (GGDEF)-like protein/PAS domain S-box-containing protein